jgi:dienelactone hydrolase
MPSHRLRVFLLSASLCAVAVAVAARPGRALELSVIPRISMVDRPVEIAVRAAPSSLVRMRFVTQRFGLTFSSDAVFQVPASGVLRLSRSAPLSGSYQGTNAMGLFWSAVPTSEAPKPFNAGRDSDLAARPFRIVASSGSQAASASGQRIVVADDVERRVVDSGDFVATMFVHTASGCQPGVVVLGGSEGGVPEEQAAVLASHGLTTMALAYFGAPGLSKSLTDIPIELVQRAIDFMQKQSTVCDRGVALIGGSKGAELALLAASVFNNVRAVVALKPASVVFYGLFGDTTTLQSSWSYRGQPVPFANGSVSSAIQRELSLQQSSHRRPTYVDDYRARLQNNTDPAAIIKVERIMAPILLVAGSADRLWPSEYMAKQILQRRGSMSEHFADQILLYADAGHLIGMPFVLAKAELAHSSLDVGGSPEADEMASEKSWPVIVEFLQNAYPTKKRLTSSRGCTAPAKLRSAWARR